MAYLITAAVLLVTAILSRLLVPNRWFISFARGSELRGLPANVTIFWVLLCLAMIAAIAYVARRAYNIGG